MEKYAKRLHVKGPLAPYLRVAFAEFLGTCVLIVFGDGSVAQSVLSGSKNGEFLSINWSWCMAVVLGVTCSINVSGGHINPAVTLAMSILGRLPWKMVPVYFLAQYLGAFTGAAIVYLVYYEALGHFDSGVRVTDPSNATATAGIFSTFPQGYLTAGEGLADQIIGTAMLLLLVLAISDKKNSNIPMYLAPIYVGFTVFVIGAAYGFNCGYAINPARDLGPRIFTAMAGWGVEVFSYRGYNWFWVPVIGPHIGAILGSWIYLLLVEIHWHEEEDIEESVTFIRKTTGGEHNHTFVPDVEALEDDDDDDEPQSDDGQGSTKQRKRSDTELAEISTAKD